MSDNDGGDGIGLRNMNGKNAAEAVSIAKCQKLRIEDGYRSHGSNTLVALDPDQELEKNEALNMRVRYESRELSNPRADHGGREVMYPRLCINAVK